VVDLIKITWSFASYTLSALDLGSGVGQGCQGGTEQIPLGNCCSTARIFMKMVQNTPAFCLDI